jgi:hypothetical protein
MKGALVNYELVAGGGEDLNLGGRLLSSAHRLICGHIEQGLCDLCLCLSNNVAESRAVLLSVLLSCLRSFG